MEPDNRKFLGCDCHTEGLVIEEDFDEEYKPMHLFYLSYWTLGHQGRELGLWDRIRYCWRLLTTGLPYGDMIVMHRDKAIELGKWILERTEKSDPKYW